MKGYRIQNFDSSELIGDHLRSETWNYIGEEARSGVSVCRSLVDLTDYFAHGTNQRTDGGRLDIEELVDMRLVVYEGRESDDLDHDHDHIGSPVLIHPEAVIEERALTPKEVVAMSWGPASEMYPMQALEAVAGVYGVDVAVELLGMDKDHTHEDAEVGGYVITRDGKDIAIYYPEGVIEEA